MDPEVVDGRVGRGRRLEGGLKRTSIGRGLGLEVDVDWKGFDPDVNWKGVGVGSGRRLEGGLIRTSIGRGFDPDVGLEGTLLLEGMLLLIMESTLLGIRRGSGRGC